MDPGQCGTTCVPNDPAMCAGQQRQYELARQRITAEYDVRCTQNADCGGFLVSTPCARYCEVAPKPSQAAMMREVAAIDDSCSACPLPAPAAPTEDTGCDFNTCWKNHCISGGEPL